MKTQELFKAFYDFKEGYPDRFDFIEEIHDAFDEIASKLNSEIKFLDESGISKKRPKYFEALQNIIKKLRILETDFLKAVDYD